MKLKREQLGSGEECLWMQEYMLCHVQTYRILIMCIHSYYICIYICMYSRRAKQYSLVVRLIL